MVIDLSDEVHVCVNSLRVLISLSFLNLVLQSLHGNHITGEGHPSYFSYCLTHA